MASAKNQVIAGDMIGARISMYMGVPEVSAGNGDVVQLTKTSVDDYQLLTEEKIKSVSSGVVRGAIGGALLGPIGMLAGALTLKSKGINTVAIMLKDGRRLLIEVDDKMYKAIITKCF